MYIRRLSALLLALSAAGVKAPAQQSVAPANPSNAQVQLDVVVTPKLGSPVAELRQQDFTLLVDNVPKPLTSFRAISKSEGPVEVVLIIDALNIYYTGLARERGEIVKFLRANGGRLALPTTVEVFTEKGFFPLGGPTKDGTALAKSVAGYDFSLRTIRRSQGFYGAVDRFSLSINALAQLAAQESTHPGRKLVLWISPGWPLLSGPGVQLDGKQEKGIFANIANLSARLRGANITLYSIDSLGTEEPLGRVFYYQAFLKGVSKPDQAAFGDLSLQVLAVQSGGLALNSTDVSDSLSRCVDDAEAYYALSFSALPVDRPNEYHRIEIKVAEPGLVARSRQGYYSQP